MSPPCSESKWIRLDSTNCQLAAWFLGAGYYLVERRKEGLFSGIWGKLSLNQAFLKKGPCTTFSSPSMKISQWTAKMSMNPWVPLGRGAAARVCTVWFSLSSCRSGVHWQIARHHTERTPTDPPSAWLSQAPPWGMKGSVKEPTALSKEILSITDPSLQLPWGITQEKTRDQLISRDRPLLHEQMFAFKVFSWLRYLSVHMYVSLCVYIHIRGKHIINYPLSSRSTHWFVDFFPLGFCNVALLVPKEFNLLCLASSHDASGKATDKLR